MSSQASVSMLVSMILVLEYKDRGLICGWPIRGVHDSKLLLKDEVAFIIRKYHGYVFSWALIWTFWTHPLENSFSHISGQTITWFPLLQSSLIYTFMHKNRKWRFFIEACIFGHPAIVAVTTQIYGIETLVKDAKVYSIWEMFTFGFLFVVFATQIFTLRFWVRDRVWKKSTILCSFILLTIIYYASVSHKSLKDWNEVVRIPTVLYKDVWVCYVSVKIALFFRGKQGAGKWSVIEAIFWVSCCIIFSVLAHYLEIGNWVPFLAGIMFIPSIFGFFNAFAMVALDNYIAKIPRKNSDVQTCQ